MDTFLIIHISIFNKIPLPQKLHPPTYIDKHRHIVISSSNYFECTSTTRVCSNAYLVVSVVSPLTLLWLCSVFLFQAEIKEKLNEKLPKNKP